MGTERHALPGNAAKCWQRFCCTALRKSLNLFILKCFRKHWNKKSGQLVITGQHVSTDFCFFILFLSLHFNPYSCETFICWRISYSSCDCSISGLWDFCHSCKLQVFSVYASVWLCDLFSCFTFHCCLSLLAEGRKWAGKEKGMAQARLSGVACGYALHRLSPAHKIERC